MIYSGNLIYLLYTFTILRQLFREKIGWEVKEPLALGMKKTFSWINKQVNNS